MVCRHIRIYLFVCLSFIIFPFFLCPHHPHTPSKFLFPHPPSNLKQNLNIGKTHIANTSTCCLDSPRKWGGKVAPCPFSGWHLPPIRSDIPSSVTSPSLPTAYQHLVSASVHHHVVVAKRNTILYPCL